MGNRRAIGVLIAFLALYLPVVVGMTWLVDRLVFEPVCGEVDGRPATSYERNDVVGVGSGPDECRYEGGAVRELREVVSTPVAVLLDIGDFLVRFGTPFLLIWFVLRLLPDPAADD